MWVCESVHRLGVVRECVEWVGVRECTVGGCEGVCRVGGC